MTSKIKRNRRTKDDLETLLNAIQTILNAEEGQITIRHLFYRLVGLQVIEKTEPAYHQLCNHLSKWRRSGNIHWNNFSDSTRRHIQPTTFDDIPDALNTIIDVYRRNLWDTQPQYIEVWVEKDAMVSILSDTTLKLGVPLYVARGFSSLTGLYAASETFKKAIAKGKEVIIYHLGDYDPSGIAAGNSIESAMRDDFNVEITFNRLAVNKSQIESLQLQTRPVKLTDKRAKNWEGGCVELDTMKPADIKSIVYEAITQHIDGTAWNDLQEIERLEKDKLTAFCKEMAA